MEELRDKIYEWSLNLIKDGREIEGIFLLISTWNFAYFRYHMRDFPLNDFEKALKECDFDYFKDKNFVKVDFNDKPVKEKIIEIYSKLSNFKGIKWVGATKIMHLKNPEFFIMWDGKIIKHYKAKTSPEGYLDFMELMQEKNRNNEFGKLDSSFTIPRAIDLYNMRNFSTGA